MGEYDPRWVDQGFAPSAARGFCDRGRHDDACFLVHVRGSELLRVPRGLRQFTDDSDPTALIVISGVLMIVGLFRVFYSIFSSVRYISGQVLKSAESMILASELVEGMEPAVKLVEGMEGWVPHPVCFLWLACEEEFFRTLGAMSACWNSRLASPDEDSDREEEKKVDELLARMNELMAMVSSATGDPEATAASRRRASTLRKRSWEKRMIRGPVASGSKEASGSEDWDPAMEEDGFEAAEAGEGLGPRDSGAPVRLLMRELLQRRSQAEEVAELAKLVSLQCMQLEVKNRRTEAAERRCQAMERRAVTAERYAAALERELALSCGSVRTLEVEKRSLEADNAALKDQLHSKSKEEGAEQLHSEATRLLEKLSQAPSPRARGAKAEETPEKRKSNGQGKLKSVRSSSCEGGVLNSWPLTPDQKGPRPARHTLGTPKAGFDR
ncbi:unnamed protein product [Effrenium voratum]|nr:unnamed protein product [Effrenium voratum]